MKMQCGNCGELYQGVHECHGFRMTPPPDPAGRMKSEGRDYVGDYFANERYQDLVSAMKEEAHE